MPARKKATSTEIAPAKQSTPALQVDVNEYIRQQQEALKQRLGGGSAPPTITIDQDSGEHFVVTGQGETEAPLSLVIVSFTNHYAWWEDPYVQGEAKAPDCFAIGQVIETMTPSANAPFVQSPEGCGVCPLNEFGSRGKGKACKNQRVLAVLPPDSPEDELHLVRVSPTGLLSFDSYIKAVSAVHNTACFGVETTFNIQKAGKGFTTKFDPREARPLSPDLVAAYYARVAEADELLAREPDVDKSAAPQQTVKAAPRRTRARGRR